MKLQIHPSRPAPSINFRPILGNYYILDYEALKLTGDPWDISQLSIELWLERIADKALAKFPATIVQGGTTGKFQVFIGADVLVDAEGYKAELKVVDDVAKSFPVSTMGAGFWYPQVGAGDRRMGDRGAVGGRWGSGSGSDGLAGVDRNSFIWLNDTPDSYDNAAGLFVRVNPTGDGLEFTAEGTNTFVLLTDTPSNYAGDAGKIVAVNDDGGGVNGNALEFIDPASVGKTLFVELDDTPANYTGADGLVVTVDEVGGQLVFTALPTIPDEFTDLIDTPADYAGQANKIVAVNDDGGGVNGNALEFIDPGTVGTKEFTGLTDTPNSYEPADAGRVVAVKNDLSGLEFITGGGGGASNFLELSDTPGNYTGANGYYVTVNEPGGQLVFSELPAIPDTFTDLSDTPGNYTGAGLGLVRVNAAENAVEFGDPAGGAFIGNRGEINRAEGDKDIFRVNDPLLTVNTTIPVNKNASAAGPITVDDGITLTVDGNLSIV